MTVTSDVVAKAPVQDEAETRRVMAKYPTLAAKVIVSENTIKQRLQTMAGEIAAAYEGKASAKSPLLVVCILKGSIHFTSDLVRALGDCGVPCQLDFMMLSSYLGTGTTGSVQLRLDMRSDAKGRHILVAEDIIDTGLTMTKLRDMLLTRDPASLKYAALLDKKAGRTVPFEGDFVAFPCPHEFVIGYGLDYDENYRELRDVIVLKPEVYGGANPHA